MKLTHPERIVFPEDKITKLQLAEYYMAISEWILPYIINRPLTLLRCPDQYDKCFYQKHLTEAMPDSIYGINIKEKEGKGEYLYIKNQTGLLALIQMSTLELHPWGSKIKNVELPDMIIFDFDPAPDVHWKEVVVAAQEARAYLMKAGLQSFVRTTGGKGLHVVVPVKPKHDWETVKQFAKSFVDYMVASEPNKYIGTASMEKRHHKIFIDYLRNGRGATAVASYSTRARIHA